MCCVALLAVSADVALSNPSRVVDGVVDLQVRGTVSCDVRCRCSNAAVRIVDGGIGTGSSKGRQIDRREVVLGEQFNFRAREYWWSATITNEVPTLALLVDVLITADGCLETSRSMDLNSVVQKAGVFEVDIGSVVLECPPR